MIEPFIVLATTRLSWQNEISESEHRYLIVWTTNLIAKGMNMQSLKYRDTHLLDFVVQTQIVTGLSRDLLSSSAQLDLFNFNAKGTFKILQI